MWIELTIFKVFEYTLLTEYRIILRKDTEGISTEAVKRVRRASWHNIIFELKWVISGLVQFYEQQSIVCQ